MKTKTASRRKVNPYHFIAPCSSRDKESKKIAIAVFTDAIENMPGRFKAHVQIVPEKPHTK